MMRTLADARTQGAEQNSGISWGGRSSADPRVGLRHPGRRRPRGVGRPRPHPAGRPRRRPGHAGCHADPVGSPRAADPDAARRGAGCGSSARPDLWGAGSAMARSTRRALTVGVSFMLTRSAGARCWLARTAPTERYDGTPWCSNREGALRRQLDCPRVPGNKIRHRSNWWDSCGGRRAGRDVREGRD